MQVTASDHRAVSLGSIWMNSAFVAPLSRPRRLWRRASVRVSVVQWFLIGVMFLVWFPTLYFVSLPFSYIPGIRTLISPWIIAIIVSPILAWVTGRRLSRSAPYRRHTGEGLVSYLWVKSDQRGKILGRLVGRPVATNRYWSRATGRLREVECIEWIGTARCPQTVRRPEGTDSDHLVDYYLEPRTVPDNWVPRYRERQSRLSPGKHRDLTRRERRVLRKAK